MFILLTFSRSVKLQTFQGMYSTAVHDEIMTRLKIITFAQTVSSADRCRSVPFSLQLLRVVSVASFLKLWSHLDLDRTRIQTLTEVL